MQYTVYLLHKLRLLYLRLPQEKSSLTSGLNSYDCKTSCISSARIMESLLTKFEEHLSCPICLEQFKDPKVLPCLHSYCHECIVKLNKTGNYITCPECRMTVEVRKVPLIL